MRLSHGVLLLALLGLVAACGGPSTSVGSLKGKSPQEIIGLVGAAVQETAYSFHFVDVTRVGSQVTTLRGYDTNEGADQLLSGAAPTLEVERTEAGGIFVRGTAAALEESLNLVPAVATANANRWIVLEQGDAPYSTVAGTLDPGKEIDAFLPNGPFKLEGPLQFHGRSVLAVVGRAPSVPGSTSGHVATLYVPTEPPYTPVGAALTFGSGSGSGIEAVVFSEWNQREAPPAPVDPVAYAKLTG